MIKEPTELFDSLPEEDQREILISLKLAQDLRYAGHHKKGYDILNPFEQPPGPMEPKNPSTRLHKLGEHVEF